MYPERPPAGYATCQLRRIELHGITRLDAGLLFTGAGKGAPAAPAATGELEAKLSAAIIRHTERRR